MPASGNIHQQASANHTQQSADRAQSPTLYTGAHIHHIHTSLPDAVFSESILFHFRILAAPWILPEHDRLCSAYRKSIQTLYAKK